MLKKHALILVFLFLISNTWSQEIKTSLKVLTYNLWFKIFDNTELPNQRLTQICEELINGKFKNYDLLFFQEVWQKKVQEKILACAKESPFKYSFYNKNQMSFFIFFKDGLLLLSKYPIDEENSLSEKFNRINFFKYKTSVAEFFVLKGFLDAIINVNGNKIHAITTHLAANYGRYGKEKGKRQGKLRKKQLINLLNYIKTIEGPFVLGGDFNLAVNGLAESYSDEIQHKINPLFLLIKQSTNMMNAPEAARKPDSPIHTYSIQNTFNRNNNEQSEGQIDQIFCGSNDSKIRFQAINGLMDFVSTYRDGSISNDFNLSDHFAFGTTCEFNYLK